MPITFVAASSQYITMASEFAALRTTSSFCFWLATTQQGNDLPYQAPCVAGIEQDQGEQDIFWGWLDYNSGSSRLGISKGNTLGANSGTINDGTLRHFCFTWNSSDGASQCFVDGALSSSGTADSGDVSLTFADLCRLLDQYAVARSYVDGTLDDVRIYNRILGANEVAAIHGCRGGDSIHYGLVSRFKMDELSPGTAVSAVSDQAGNNSGTPHNSPTYAGAAVMRRRRRA